MRILLLVVALLVLAGVVLAASAKLDTPSQSSTVKLVIEAPREPSGPPSWTLTPTLPGTRTSPRRAGTSRRGRSSASVIEAPGKDSEDATMKVLTARFEQLRIEDRLVLPGVRDEEHVPGDQDHADPRPLRGNGPAGGLLAPFADLEPTKNGLEAMAAALAQRVETAP